MIKNSEKRRFSGSHRQTLFLIAHGCCLKCKTPLMPGWHADHRTPYSKGGKTQITNGQAYCPVCNLKKSNSDQI